MPEERAAVQAAWASLPEGQRADDQCLGRWSSGCGATWGVVERCDFACTACYLAKGSNAAPPMPFAEVRAQIDAMRAHYGPGGRIQITAGEVTLLPVGELVEIMRYARSKQLLPMVMTHGQHLLRDPGYLERLVIEGGLDRLAIHIDTTQRGRDGGDPSSEADLMPVRDAMAELIRSTRRRTRRTLHAAHTVTVTRGNLRELPDIVRWTVRNADAFRMLALQPVAEVGRTRERSVRGRPDAVSDASSAAVWEAIHSGLGRRINNRTWAFGHADCSQLALLWVAGARLVEVRREGSRLDRWFVRRYLHGGLQGWCMTGERAPVALARLAGRLARDPGLLAVIPFFCAVRALPEWSWILRPRLPRPLAISVHNFMDAAQLETDAGRERVAACVFRVPVGGRMVSMCEFNGGGQRAREVNETLLGAVAAPAGRLPDDAPVAGER